MGKFIRENLPDPVTYYPSQGVVLQGNGNWRTGPCTFHNGSDSMRVNTLTGAWVCMAGCGARGGDVLAYHMATHGMGFVEAAKAMGAFDGDGTDYKGRTRPTPIPPRALLQLAADELMVGAMVMADVLNGCLTDADFDRFRDAAGRVSYIAGVANGQR
jgi:hypothetical protein